MRKGKINPSTSNMVLKSTTFNLKSLLNPFFFYFNLKIKHLISYIYSLLLTFLVSIIIPLDIHNLDNFHYININSKDIINHHLKNG